MEKSSGFVLKSLKYGDTSAIVHIYSRSFGIQSLLIKGFYSAKNKKFRMLTYPFSQVEFTFRQNNRSDLILPQQLQNESQFAEMYQHPVKLLILQFMAEILYSVLKEDEASPAVFDFVEGSLNEFNERKNGFGEFHLVFLTELTKYLGFFPRYDHSDLPYFDLLNGSFTSDKNAQYVLDEELTKNWRTLITSHFDTHYTNLFIPQERRELLNGLIMYYSLQVPGFREPKSLEVLKEILSA